MADFRFGLTAVSHSPDLPMVLYKRGSTGSLSNAITAKTHS
jgi:hypothetical protein